MEAIPAGLQQALEEFTRAALQDGVTDINAFGANFFSSRQRRSDDFRTTKRPRIATDSIKESDVDSEEPIPVYCRDIRRASVFALPPTLEDCLTQMISHAKTTEQAERIKGQLQSQFLFRQLQSYELDTVVDVMEYQKVLAGETVIKQGDEGDYFYVVASGLFHVFASGVHVAEYNGVGTFGELALLHDCPRAATVIARQDGGVWRLDRLNFCKTVLNHGAIARQKYEAVLAEFPLLTDLTPRERSAIADALEPCGYGDGQLIINQGGEADYFFLLMHGTVRVTRHLATTQREIEITTLGSGSYFGELALLTNKPRAASIWAVGNVHCARLSRDRFERVLGCCSDVMKRNANSYEHRLQMLLGTSPNTKGYLGLELTCL
eukprot:m.12449 g.12449  ORF g.12449 m.12449 type:complete len:379 (-) comp9292_c0_seq1:234-1370(-)